MNYIKYTDNEIKELNKNKIWYNTPINIQKHDCNNNKVKYFLHPTGYANLNGRKYIALPSDCDTSDPYIKKKYNLL